MLLRHEEMCVNVMILLQRNGESVVDFTALCITTHKETEEIRDQRKGDNKLIRYDYQYNYNYVNRIHQKHYTIMQNKN